MSRRAIALCLLLLLPAFAGCTELTSTFGQLQNQRTEPGDNAADLLRADKYPNLVVEIDYVPGSAPDPASERQLMDVLTTETAKARENIRIVKDPSLPARGENHKYTWREIQALEKEHRDHYAEGKTLGLYILWLDGGSESDRDNNKVLGAAYHGTSLVMFKGNIRSSSGGGLLSNGCSLDRIEPIITKHELGHVFGLVNNGAPMVTPHEDPNHPGHSKYKDSIMYWAVERSSLFGIYNDCSDVPTEFDQYDKADLRAVREG